MIKNNTTRRTVLTGLAAAGTLAATNTTSAAITSKPAKSWDAIVVGAGVFGVWAAVQLQRAGKRVLLVDANGPANVRSSSGGETRMIRSDYGADAIYTQMSTASLKEWKQLSDRAALPLFHQSGVLFFFQKMVDYARQSIETHNKLGLPLSVLDAPALRKKFPQIDFSGVEFGLYEPDFGALMARRAILYLVDAFVKAGGSYRQASAGTPHKDGHSLNVGGKTLHADRLVYACGPWMAKIFPDLLGERLFVTRQELAFVAPPAGNNGFLAANMPGWADYNDGSVFYGFPDIEGRGFKIAHDAHGPVFDAEVGNRHITPEGLKTLRTYIARRFPALADAPFVGSKVCQYTNSSNGDFLIDHHPAYKNIVLVGAGSGHGFKHGPEVGRLAAALALGDSSAMIERFSLASKTTRHNRTVL